MKKLLSLGILLPALFLGVAAERGQAQIGVAISVNVAPPPLPVYEQPPCPVEGYLWTPGYWAWDPDYGYYWVPGVWVAPPQVGLLWTPGYWGYDGGAYGWHDGYWAPQVGYYGGVDYGWGYDGAGFIGGMWAGHVFRYNTAVMRVNTRVIHNVYVDRAGVRREEGRRASFNGPGGVTARPTAREEQAMHERHFERTAAQTEHMTSARRDPQARFATNHGAPREAAMARPGERAVAATNRPSAAEIRAAQAQSHGAHAAAVTPRRGAAGHPAGGENRPMAGRNAATRPNESRPPATGTKEARPAREPAAGRSVSPARTQERAPARPATRGSESHPVTPQRTERSRPAPTPVPHQESRPAPRPVPHTQAAPRTENRPVQRPEVHAAPHAQARPAPRPEERPAQRPEARPETRPTPHPAERPAQHPQARAAPHPENHPASHPEEKPH
jgi:WXXGXW repeat (2 copies)